jgi:hypothetical protein
MLQVIQIRRREASGTHDHSTSKTLRGKKRNTSQNNECSRIIGGTGGVRSHKKFFILRSEMFMLQVVRIRRREASGTHDHLLITALPRLTEDKEHTTK